MKCEAEKAKLREEYEKKLFDQGEKAAGSITVEARKHFEAECKIQVASTEVARMWEAHQAQLDRERKTNSRKKKKNSSDKMSS